MSFNFPSKQESIYTNNLVLTSQTGTDVDITCSTGNIKINGSVPGGGGGSLPINGAGDITLNTGNLTALGDGIADGKIEGQTIKSVGTLVVSGGGANIIGGINSTGDIQTLGGNTDIVSSRNFILDGTQVIKRTDNAGVVSETEYVRHVGGAIKQETNIFTSTNEFQDNVTVSGVGTQFNVPQGSIGSNTANINTGITCGSISVDNGSEGSGQFCNARSFGFKPSGSLSWTLEQQPVTGQVPDVLQISQAQAFGGTPKYIAITSSDYNPQSDQPNIIIDPQTQALGGKMYINTVQFGRGIDPRIESAPTGPDSNDVKIIIPNNSGKIRFYTNSNDEKLRIGNNQINVYDNFYFGDYLFLPQQLIYTFTGAVIDDNPPTLFNDNGAIFTLANNGTTGQSLSGTGEGFYKLTINAAASSGGTYGAFRYSCDFPYTTPNFSVGTVITRFEGNFSGANYPATLAKPDLCGFGLAGVDFKLCFPSVSAGSETYSGTLVLTKMPYGG